MSTAAFQFLQQEKTRLQAENKSQKEEILTLHRYISMMAELCHTAGRVADEKNPLDTIDRLLYKVIQVAGASDGSLSLLNQETNDLLFHIVHGTVRQKLTGHRIKSDVGVVGWIISEGQPVIVNNPRQDWRFSLQIDEEFAFLTRSILGVPVMKQDRPIGVIQILNKKTGSFTDTDLTLASVLADVAAIALIEIKSRSEVG